MMAENNQEGIETSALVRKKAEEVRKELWKDGAITGFRALLQLVPFGFGSAIDVAYFGFMEQRLQRRMDEAIVHLKRELERLGKEQANAKDLSRFSTDEFAYLFGNLIQRIGTEAQEEKRRALHGILVSVVVDHPKFSFDRKSFFLRALDVMEDIHIHVLRCFAGEFQEGEGYRYVSVAELYRRLSARADADQNYVYAALDTLANKDFVITKSVPLTWDGVLERDKQEFRLTALGDEFLKFIRSS